MLVNICDICGKKITDFNYGAGQNIFDTAFSGVQVTVCSEGHDLKKVAEVVNTFNVHTLKTMGQLRDDLFKSLGGMG